MKKLIIIPFLFICLSLSATKWYFSPTGNDATGDGSIGNPWKTWGKAFNWEAISAGDTVYFRGGIYHKNLSNGDNDWYYPSRSSGGTGYAITRDGTINDTLKYWAYPGEVPILDCLDAYNIENRLHYGIRAIEVNYVHFKGLIIQNVNQVPGFGDGSGIGDSQATGCRIYGNHLVIENCTFKYIWGHGLELDGSSAPDFNYVINCDAHNCVDSLSTFQPGNDGAGFAHQKHGRVLYDHCRAWLCGDQGWSNYAIDVGTEDQYTEYNGCWGFCNGCLEGYGHAFKFGRNDVTDGNLKRTFIGCIAAYNRMEGWKSCDQKSFYPMYAHLYNNTSYHNGYYPDWDYEGIGAGGGGYGFAINNTKGTDEDELDRILKNNIAYDNQHGAILLQTGSFYTHDHNTWDIPLTLTGTDFLSVDSTGITAARQADGSLPDNNCYNYFLHPSSTSQVIDAGTDLGYGDDIGAFQYEETGVGPLVVFTTTVYPHTDWALAGGNVYDDGGGSIDARGVCWSESENPTIADSHTSDGTGAGVYSSTLTGLIEGTTYHARAYAHNEVGYGYGADVEFETLTSGGGKTIVFHNGKMIFHNGKIIVH